MVPPGISIGLFGVLDIAAGPTVISNLTLDGPLLAVTGWSQTGVLAGEAHDDITLNDISITGPGSLTSTFLATGGMVGLSDNLTINDCRVEIDVTGVTNTGGVLGATDRATITNCNVDNTVTSTGTNTGGPGGVRPVQYHQRYHLHRYGKWR